MDKSSTRLDREELLLNDQMAWQKLADIVDGGTKGGPREASKWGRVKKCLGKELKDKNKSTKMRKELLPLVFDQLVNYY